MLRERSPQGEVEVYLQRRHRKASFMSSAFVFPGGGANPDEDDLRVTAARELFEEAGVLFCDGEVPEARAAAWRAALNAGEGELGALLREEGRALAVDPLIYYAHWITPSVEKKRFSAVFYVAVLPAGQTPSVDNKEAVDEIWVTPAEALARSGDLRLPPPQVRTFWELRPAAENGLDALMDAAREREAHRHAIIPRLLPTGSPVTLLLPWDPEYQSAGAGEALAMPENHPLATGPSRFVLEDMTWKHIAAPTSPSAE